MVLVGMHQGDLWLADVEAKIEPHTTRSLLADVHKAPPSTVKVSVPDGWECSVFGALGFVAPISKVLGAATFSPSARMPRQPFIAEFPF